MFSKLSVSAKMGAMFLVVNLLGVGTSLYASSAVQHVDQTHNQVRDGFDKATLYIARMARTANAVGYGVYRTMESDPASAEGREAGERVRGFIGEMQKNYSLAASVLPDRARELGVLNAQIAQIAQSATNAVEKLSTDDREGALVEAKAIDPVLGKMVDDAVALNVETLARGDAAAQEVEAAADTTSLLLVLGSLFVALAGFAAAIGFSRAIVTKPLNRLAGTMSALAGGDVSVTVEDVDRSDEVGRMAKAVNVFKEAAQANRRLEAQAVDNRTTSERERECQRAIDGAKAEDLRTFVRSVERGFEALSMGDLTVRMTEALSPEFEPIRERFNGSVGQLEASIASVVDAVGSMQVGLGQIGVAAGDLSQRTEQQAASLEQTVAALSEVMKGVNATAADAADAQGTAATTLKVAERGGTVVADAVTAMGQIQQSSDSIARIIGVIDEIAFQTNLLALNAGVEAARAGEAGRGFAVVAQEVRGLAQRSAEAAKEIKGLIAESVGRVERGVELVATAGRSLGEIVGQVGKMDMAIGAIASGAREQSTSLREVSIAADQMDKVTQQNAAMVEETTAATQTLLAETKELSRSMDRFKAHAPASGRRVPTTANPAPRSRVAKPVMQRKVTGRGGAALLPMVEEEQDASWEEF